MIYAQNLTKLTVHVRPGLSLAPQNYAVIAETDVDLIRMGHAGQIAIEGDEGFQSPFLISHASA